MADLIVGSTLSDLARADLANREASERAYQFRNLSAAQRAEIQNQAQERGLRERIAQLPYDKATKDRILADELARFQHGKLSAAQTTQDRTNRVISLLDFVARMKQGGQLTTQQQLDLAALNSNDRDNAVKANAALDKEVDASWLREGVKDVKDKKFANESAWRTAKRKELAPKYQGIYGGDLRIDPSSSTLLPPPPRSFTGSAGQNLITPEMRAILKFVDPEFDWDKYLGTSTTGGGKYTYTPDGELKEKEAPPPPPPPGAPTATTAPTAKRPITGGDLLRGGLDMLGPIVGPALEAAAGSAYEFVRPRVQQAAGLVYDWMGRPTVSDVAGGVMDVAGDIAKAALRPRVPAPSLTYGGGPQFKTGMDVFAAPPGPAPIPPTPETALPTYGGGPQFRTGMDLFAAPQAPAAPSFPIPLGTPPVLSTLYPRNLPPPTIPPWLQAFGPIPGVQPPATLPPASYMLNPLPGLTPPLLPPSAGAFMSWPKSIPPLATPSPGMLLDFYRSGRTNQFSQPLIPDVTASPSDFYFNRPNNLVPDTTSPEYGLSPYTP
jgi:hypothetical protein